MADWRRALLRGDNDPGGPGHKLLRPPPGWDPEPGVDAVEMSPTRFAAASGGGLANIVEAAEIGLIAGRYEPISWYGRSMKRTLRVRPGDTLPSIVRGMFANWVPLSDMESFRWFRRCMVLAGIKVEELPDAWIDDYLALPDDYAYSDDGGELRVVAFGMPTELFQLGRRINIRRDGYARIKLAAPITGDVRKALSDALSDGVPALVGTCLEPGVGKEFEPPTPRMAARLLSMEPGPARDVAIADCCDAVENAGIVEETEIPLCHFRMAIVLHGAAPGDLREFRRRIKAYLKGKILKWTSPHARVKDVYAYMAADTRMVAWAEEAPDDLRDWLLANRPRPPRDNGFYALVERYHAKLAGKGLSRRKGRSDQIADSFDDMLGECEANYAAVREFEAECAKGHLEAGDDPDYRFSYPAALPGPFGRDTGRTMLVNLRSVTVQDLMDQVLARFDVRKLSKTFMSSHAPGGKHHDAGFTSRRLIVFDSVEPMDGGPQPEVPAWLRPYATGAALPPRKLSTPQVEVRRAYIARSGIGAYYQPQRGVFRFSDDRECRLAVWAFAVKGAVVVPVADVVRGAALGRTIFTGMSLTLSRYGAFRQMLDDDAGWDVANTTDGRKLPAIKVIPKLPHALRHLPREEREVLVPFEPHVSEVIRELIDTLIKLDGDDPDEPGRLRRAFHDGSLPADFGDERFILQADGYVLRSAGATYALSFLFGRRILPHDLRHAGSARQYEDGDTLGDVGTSTGHTQYRRVRKYVQRGDGRLVGGGIRSLTLRDKLAALGSKPRKHVRRSAGEKQVSP